jgi:hypothetical protein
MPRCTPVFIDLFSCEQIAEYYWGDGSGFESPPIRISVDCLLGRIVERASWLTPVTSCAGSVLNPSGAIQMFLAGNAAFQRASQEVTYFSSARHAPAHLRNDRMDSHARRVATPPTCCVSCSRGVEGVAEPVFHD